MSGTVKLTQARNRPHSHVRREPFSHRPVTNKTVDMASLASVW
jgi:hypothetical protein